MLKRIVLGSLCLVSIAATVHAAADPGAMKKRAVAGVAARAKLAQQINDSGIQLRRARIPGGRDLALSHGPARAERLQSRARRGRHPDRLGRALDERAGRAGDRARLGHRLHSQGVAEAGNSLARAAHRRRAGSRRRTQLRAGGEHRRGAGRAGRSCAARTWPAR